MIKIDVVYYDEDDSLQATGLRTNGTVDDLTIKGTTIDKTLGIIESSMSHLKPFKIRISSISFSQI
jgi:hypothetical protein